MSFVENPKSLDYETKQKIHCAACTVPIAQTGEVHIIKHNNKAFGRTGAQAQSLVCDDCFKAKRDPLLAHEVIKQGNYYVVSELNLSTIPDKKEVVKAQKAIKEKKEEDQKAEKEKVKAMTTDEKVDITKLGTPITPQVKKEIK